MSILQKLFQGSGVGVGVGDGVSVGAGVTRLVDEVVVGDPGEPDDMVGSGKI